MLRMYGDESGAGGHAARRAGLAAAGRARQVPEGRGGWAKADVPIRKPRKARMVNLGMRYIRPPSLNWHYNQRPG